jgi:hypothetical protein
MADVQALHTFLRGEFDAEAQSSFARLKRVPDTHVQKFLDYYRSLNAADQDDLADASTLWGALHLAGPAGDGHGFDAKTRSAWERWRYERVMMTSYRYQSVSELRACVAQAKMDRANGKPPTVPKELEEYAASIRSVKAPDLRKHVRPVMESLLNARPAKMGGGEWVYDGTLDGSRVRVGIDYGGRLAQLRYSVGVLSAKPPVAFARAGFETVLGAGFGDWDFIVEENVNDSMLLLSELVRYVAELPRRLPERCLNGVEFED